MEKKKDNEQKAEPAKKELSKLYEDDPETLQINMGKLKKKPLLQFKITNILARDRVARAIIHGYIKEGKRIDQLTREEWERIPLRTRRKIEKA